MQAAEPVCVSCLSLRVCLGARLGGVPGGYRRGRKLKKHEHRPRNPRAAERQGCAGTGGMVRSSWVGGWEKRNRAWPRIAVLPGRKVTARLAPALAVRLLATARAPVCILQIEQLESLLGRAPPAYPAILAVMAARLLNLHNTAVAKRNGAHGLRALIPTRPHARPRHIH